MKSYALIRTIDFLQKKRNSKITITLREEGREGKGEWEEEVHKREEGSIKEEEEKEKILRT